MRRVCRTEVGNGKVGALYRLSYTNHAIVRGAVTRNKGPAPAARRATHALPRLRRRGSDTPSRPARSPRGGARRLGAGAGRNTVHGAVAMPYDLRCASLYDPGAGIVADSCHSTRPGPARAFPRFRGARRRSTTTGNGELAKRLYGNIGNARACVSNRIESNTVPRLLVVALVVS